MRIIPKTAKVKIEFFKNVSIVDTIIGIVGLALELLILLTNLAVSSKIIGQLDVKNKNAFFRTKD